MRLLEKLLNTLIILLLFVFLSFSEARITGLHDKVDILASGHAYDFFTWTVDAAWVKLTHAAIDAPRYYNAQEQHRIVIQYLQTLQDFNDTGDQIQRIFSDPSVKDPSTTASAQIQKLRWLYNRLNILAPMAEATIEMQVTAVLTDFDLTSAGQPIPWVLFHSSELPQNLVISKREKIGQETNYILTPLTVQQASSLETSVDQRLNVSSLVVDIGGLADYPTMLMFTTDLKYLTSTVPHEWTHIYLGLRPLGNNYDTPELRTMNETTASIVGSEIGRVVIQRYYPELLSDAPGSTNITYHSPATAQPFDFRAEMHTTRVHTDELLAQGKIAEAEAYMEQRRQFFWDHRYAIRKLNQAYFAFFGSYAETPGGAAGEDPVGPAVRALRAQSASLKDFLDRISQMTTYAELQKAIGNTQ